MRNLRDTLHLTEREKHSHVICKELIETVKRTNAQVIHTFLPMGSEPDIFPFIAYLLKENKTIVSPKSFKNRTLNHLVLNSLNELEDGIYGTKHPLGDNEYFGKYDLIVVPGLAFDPLYNRLGYGAGYYDTFLKNQIKPHKLGICFPFQMVDAVPLELHDVRLDHVIC